MVDRFMDQNIYGKVTDVLILLMVCIVVWIIWWIFDALWYWWMNRHE